MFKYTKVVNLNCIERPLKTRAQEVCEDLQMASDNTYLSIS